MCYIIGMKEIENNETQNKTEAGKMTNKKIYVINGSEDGVLGAYSNARLALESAINYVTSYGREMQKTENKYYTDLLKNGWVMLESGPMEDTISIGIQMHFLNLKHNKSL